MESKLSFVLIKLSFLCFAMVGADICCVMDQFEANTFYDNGNVFIDMETVPNTAYSYMNTTTFVAYDFTNSRSYLNMSGLQQSPLIPQPVPVNAVIINDNKNLIQYTVAGGKCTKQKIDPLKRECIPDNAIQKFTGYLGNSEVLVTMYSYTKPDQPFQYETIVEPKACMPVEQTWFFASSSADSGAIYTMFIGDVKPGITDPSIFDIPKPCLSETLLFQSEEDGQSVFRWADRMKGPRPFFH